MDSSGGGSGLCFFPSVSEKQCCYQMFDRHGGVSDGPYASLNFSNYTGDATEAVLVNRARVRDRMGVRALLFARQVHGDRIHCLTSPVAVDTEIAGVDGLITNCSDVGLVIQQADCQAILLFDPLREVIAAIHCGWRGSVLQIIRRTVEVMAEKYGSIPADLLATVSPSLGPCCAEFIHYKRELPPQFQEFMDKKMRFDFWGISRYQLVASGIKDENISIAAICTCCSDDYFSFRRAGRGGDGVTGRNCTVIALS